MHNLHIIITNSDNIEDACIKAEAKIEDWGGENNWRTACGAVSDKGDVYSTGEGRYCPERMLDTDENSVDFIADETATTQSQRNLVALQKILNGWTQEEGYDTAKLKQISDDMFAGNPVDGSDMYQLKEYIVFKFNQRLCKGSIWENDFREWELDECGVTRIIDNEDEQLFAVFIDMHS